MKNLLTIIIILISINCYSQDRSSRLRLDHTFIDVHLNDSDSVGVNQTYIYELFAAKDHYTTQDLLIVLDSVYGSPNVKIQLKGRKFDIGLGGWNNIGDSILWSGTSYDTTIVYSNPEKNSYRYYRLYFTSNSDIQSSLIKTIKFKFWLNETIPFIELWNDYIGQRSLPDIILKEPTFGEFIDWLENRNKERPSLGKIIDLMRNTPPRLKTIPFYE